MKIKTKDDLQTFLEAERKRYGRKNAKLPLFCFRENDLTWKFNYLLRKTEYFTNNNKKLFGTFYKYRLNGMKTKYGINIPLNVFDYGMKMIHLGSILVNGNANVGKNCSLHINTGIVAGGLDDSSPVIGDNVVLGFGSVVLGGIYLANGIAVGANAVVTKSFDEENIAIVGVPARKISDNGTANWNKTKITTD